MRSMIRVLLIVFVIGSGFSLHAMSVDLVHDRVEVLDKSKPPFRIFKKRKKRCKGMSRSIFRRKMAQEKAERKLFKKQEKRKVKRAKRQNKICKKF